jgi:hypothetical protein
MARTAPVPCGFFDRLVAKRDSVAGTRLQTLTDDGVAGSNEATYEDRDKTLSAHLRAFAPRSKEHPWVCADCRATTHGRDGQPKFGVVTWRPWGDDLYLCGACAPGRMEQHPEDVFIRQPVPCIVESTPRRSPDFFRMLETAMWESRVGRVTWRCKATYPSHHTASTLPSQTADLPSK